MEGRHARRLHDEECIISICPAIFAPVRFLQAGGRALRDSEVMMLVVRGHIPSHQLEKAVGNPERGVCIRREILNKTAKLNNALTHLPFQHYDYSKVSNKIIAV